ncbi:MAG: site-specific integrase [Rhodospirillales bacterium]|nr:site-specific integrase [Rhodospirillales bacterium]
MTEKHELMGGELHVYKRENSTLWQCSTFLNGRNYRKSTKEDSLSLAKEFAEDWYLELRGKSRAGLLKRPEKTFNDAADRFEAEYEVITDGQRNPKYVQLLKDNLRVYLRPFFGEKGLSEITPALVQDYRIERIQNPKKVKNRPEGAKPSRSKLHSEIITLRHVLKAANRQGWISAIPDVSAPYKTSGKIEHRAWFSPQEYRTLYLATRERAKNPPNNRNRWKKAYKNDRWKWVYEQFHDYVLFMGNTGLRPDEAARLEFRDVKIVKDRDSGETILEIEVRGKRGTGHCKSTTGAVLPFRRLRDRPSPKGDKPTPTDLLFPGGTPRELMNTVLDELGLKYDREGNTRTSYSLRHTYICIRLMEGADIYQIAKNCRTSVEMIEKFYASHLKTTLDASAINIRKPKAYKPGQSTEQAATRLAKMERIPPAPAEQQRRQA